jgi:hypothetical protein
VKSQVCDRKFVLAVDPKGNGWRENHVGRFEFERVTRLVIGNKFR